MKYIYSILLTLTLSVSFSQIPSNYYDSANSLTGFTLKTELKNIITSGHSDQGYDALYFAYVTTHSDNYYENDGSVLDFYSENPSGTDPYYFTHGNNQCGNYTGENDCYNREHIVPQSSFNENYPMRSDVHHVIPTDGYVNNRRSSYPFGTVGSATWTSLNGSKVGNSNVTGYSGVVFEPIDEFKGDIARALLYFATRYENTVDGYTSFEMFNGTQDQVFQSWAIDMLLDWHYNIDPVDQSEIDRNNAAYNYQGNANPFVDHPEYANMIWNPTQDNQAPSAPTNLVASNPTTNSIDLTWTASTDDIGVVSYDIYINATFFINTGSSLTAFTITGLTEETTTCFTVFAKDAAGNTSTSSNEACETTTSSGSSNVNEIFFSEYMEGGSFNKALEIANFTGSTVDLSIYTIKLSANGAAGWTTATYSFPGGAQITDGDVFVVANGSLAVCTSAVDDSNNSITAYNGNDAIGLFKNDVLIDILGTLADGTTYAQNITLVRNLDVTSPNTTFTASEWTTYAQDTCDDLGSHTTNTLYTESQAIMNINFYPNPLNGNKLFFNTNQRLKIDIYNILGKKIVSQEIDTTLNSLNLTSLSKGVYLVKISNQNQTVTKKLIKQ